MPEKIQKNTPEARLSGILSGHHTAERNGIRVHNIEILEPASTADDPKFHRVSVAETPENSALLGSLPEHPSVKDGERTYLQVEGFIMETPSGSLLLSADKIRTTSAEKAADDNAARITGTISRVTPYKNGYSSVITRTQPVKAEIPFFIQGDEAARISKDKISQGAQVTIEGKLMSATMLGPGGKRINYMTVQARSVKLAKRLENRRQVKI